VLKKVPERRSGSFRQKKKALNLFSFHFFSFFSRGIYGYNPLITADTREISTNSDGAIKNSVTVYHM
jgi:hypothetical protein